jgi:hypothetical protein
VSTDSSAGSAPSEMTVVASNQTYLVQRQGSELRVGRQTEGAVLWQDETVPVADLPDAARTALSEGRVDSQELNIALESIVQAFVQRGG